MATDNPTSHERTMAEQAALISRMKDAVLPPSAGVDVGNLKLPVLREGEFRLPPDNSPTQPLEKK